MSSTILRKVGVALGIAAGATLLSLALGRAPFARAVESKTYDWRMRITADPATARRDIVMVTIDETSIRALAGLVGRWPWPRVVHAYLIDYLARGPARVVAYDVLFTEQDKQPGFEIGEEKWTGAASDRALADSTAKAGNVIHLADATYEVSTPAAGTNVARVGRTAFVLDGSIRERPLLTAPYPALAQASAALGHNFLIHDEDGPVRRIVPFVRSQPTFLPSLGVAAALRALSAQPADVALEGGGLRIRDRRMPLQASRVPGFADEESLQLSKEALINFRGPAVLPDGTTTLYRSYSFFRLLYSEMQVLEGVKPDVDPAEFRDKLVFVGTTAAGLADVYTGPFGQTGAVPGVQVHASVADDILSARFLRPSSRTTAVLAVIACAVVVGFASAFLTAQIATAVAFATAAAMAWTAAVLFRRGVWLPLAEPLVATAVASFAGVSYQYFVEGREKRKIARLFGRYVSPDVYAELMRNPALAHLGGQRREMTVLFSDIRGFTTVSEASTPEAVVGQLNEYFSAMVDVVFRHRGTVDKFVGDMVMALFGAPLPDPEHADHAVSAALEMVEVLQQLNARWALEGRPALDIGIGINTGEMIAGNIGAESLRSYTVIGDAVNLGARLESLNKEYATRIIISEGTRVRLRGEYDSRPLGEVIVKGKTRPVAIYAIQQSTAPARSI